MSITLRQFLTLICSTSRGTVSPFRMDSVADVMSLEGAKNGFKLHAWYHAYAYHVHIHISFQYTDYRGLEDHVIVKCGTFS